MNGLRRTEADWSAATHGPGSVVGVVSYTDKFGPLGKISVFQGCRNGSTLEMSTWVMSCRAFSRRVEHQCLRVLFDRFGLKDVAFNFAPTAKNGPLQDFLETLTGNKPSGTVAVTRPEFEAHCPPLYHRLTLLEENSENHGDNG